MRVRRHGARAAGLAALLTAAAAAPALTAQEVRPDPVAYLRELVVSATRGETTVGEVPVNVTVVTREQLRVSAAQTLQDVLQEIPGLNFRFPFQAGVAHPSWQAVTLRGLGGTAASRTLVLVDGVPLNDPYFGWVRWSQVPVEVIERIEVVRGGATVSWGGQSLAGVVHVITRARDRGLSLGAQGGSQTTFRGDAVASFRSGETRGYLAGEFFDTDGYVIQREDQRGAIDIPSASSHAALRGKVDIDAGERLRLHVQGSYFDQDKDNATPQRFNETEAGFGQLGATWAGESGSTLRSNVWVQSQSYLNQFSSVDATRDSEAPSINQDVPSSGVGANLVFDRPRLGRHDLTLGADALWATGDARELFIWDGTAFERERTTGGNQALYGLFVQDRIRLGDDAQIYGGLRLDVWRQSAGFRFIEVIADGSVLTDETFENRSGTRLSHNLGFVVRASDEVGLRGSFYSGLRVPTLNELYKPFRAAGGVVNESNEALDPERVVGVEVGLDIQPDPTVLVRLTGYWNRVSDAITDVTVEEAETSGVIQPCGFVPAGGVCRQRDNVGTLRSLGLETEVAIRPAGAWLLAANYQFNPTEVTEAPGRPDLVGNDVQGSPEHRAMLRVGHLDPRTLEVVATGRWLGDRFDNDLNTGEIAGSFLVDLRFRRRLTDRVSAFASVQNLFDTVAEMSHDANDFVRVAAPRQVSGGLRVRFGG